MDLTIIVPFYNGHRQLARLLRSIPHELPVVVVDDVSDEPLRLERRNTRVLRLTTKGYFTGAVNAGIAACSTNVLVLNQDTELSAGWRELLELNRGRYALIGEKIRGTHPAWPAGYVHGTFMFMRRDALEAIGPLNERDYPLWGSTCEWQLRACRRGYEVLALDDVTGFWHERPRGENFGSSITELLEREGPGRKRALLSTPPLVSVIISSYNYGRYLRSAVNSLLGGPTDLGDSPGQTLQSFEVIIVDDGSTDDTEAIGRELADPLKGVRYVRQRNAGTAAAWNTGIKHSYGRFITCLCADDMMAPGRLERLVREAERHPHSVICDNMRVFNRGRRTELYKMFPYDFDSLLMRNTMHVGILYPRQAWLDAGGYPDIMRDGREDWAFNVALGAKGWCGVMLDTDEYLYRREGQNRTERNKGREWRAEFLSRLQQLFPGLYAGERPMGCCGRGAVRTRTVRTLGGGMTVKDLPLKAGSVPLEYTGLNSGDQQWGPWRGGSGLSYTAGGIRRVIYVDPRDVPFFDALYENTRKLFRAYTPREEVIAQVLQAPAAPESVTTEPTATEPVTTEPVTESTEELEVEELANAEVTPRKRARRKSTKRSKEQ